MEIYLARTQGFCAGVSFAIAIVDRALEKYGAPLYVYHEIVHNTFVVNDFKNRGVIFVEKVSDVPKGERIIFSAHGIPPCVIEQVKERNLQYIDATCPLVTKVHNEAVKFSKLQYEIILIGHKGHQELIGTSGYVDSKLLHVVEHEKDITDLDIPDNKKVAYLTQTTLSIDETRDITDKLKERFPFLIAPPRADICYATQNRQDAVKELTQICDLIIICGSSNSSNSNRLRETGENAGIKSFLIDKADELDMRHLNVNQKIGISSGASVPRCIVDELVKKIQMQYPNSRVHKFENPEKNIVFQLPDL